MARHETELKPVGEPDDPVADVVFVHGIGGGWDKTWRHTKTGWSWPEWLADQNWDLAVWSLDYDVPPFGFGVLSLREHAKKALDRCRYLGERPTVFIGHSMGGLLAKAMVVGAQEDASLDQLSQPSGASCSLARRTPARRGQSGSVGSDLVP